MNTPRHFLFVAAVVLTALLIPTSCNTESRSQHAAKSKKTGVLLVNHGSHSPTWRQALLDLETAVKDSLLNTGLIQGTRTAYMEYTEPSIATQLKAFDAEGYTDVIIVPIFLTVSSHSFDDIPTIIGQKEDPQSLETLKIEKIERYTPKAQIHITPLLDFTDVLKKNILRRAKALSKNPSEEGLVLIAYGDETYMKEWTNLMHAVGSYVKENAGIDAYSYGWCGHVARYNPDSTTVAINRVLKLKKQALVIPVLVAHDEMFQVKIIGDGINKTGKNKARISYIPDSILPDPVVEHWVINIATEFAHKIQQNEVALAQ
ncbi:MAG: CbiX/SirB N-terminal domain-containing protein [Cyclobacteriaceae bacterium]|nr:CbiX/SirB N-terminal domain-containing protein [Cyclobacteriaceae bacterium]